MRLVNETNLHNPLNCSLIHRKVRISVIPAQPTKSCQKGARRLINSIALKQVVMFFKTLSTGHGKPSLLWPFLFTKGSRQASTRHTNRNREREKKSTRLA